MNKGRNILLIMVVLVGVSILAFFTLFERENMSGVVGDVRYIVESEEDGTKELTFYFTTPGLTKTCTAVDSGDNVIFTVEDSEFVYGYDKVKDETYVVSGPDDQYPFQTYNKNLFRTIVKGHDRFMKFWQAGVVAAICLIGGAIILFAEEIWGFIHRKEQKEPKWSDMNGIKIAGGGIVALGVILMIVFIVI